MSLDRSLWSQVYINFPSFDCPTCKSGTLVADDKRLQKDEPTHSKKDHGEEWWGPEMIDGRFSAWLQCNKKHCQELVVITGYTRFDQMSYENEDGYDSEWVEVFSPKVAVPPLHVFAIHSKVPAKVKTEIEKVFGQFWMNSDACLNCLRIALEVIMDDLGIPSEKKTKKGSIAKLKLHDRIDVFASKNKEAANSLMALKWLGNHGSHGSKGGTTSFLDVLDALEIFEFSLDAIYVGKSKELKEKIKTINSNKGL